MDILLTCLGLAGLVIGGELLVRGAVQVAERLGLSPMVIGLTLVGFGTSAPELVTSLRAAAVGAPGIAIGNIVGSNIGNILLILGLAAVMRPIAVQPAAFRRDGAVLAAASLACAGFVLAGSIGRPAGALLFAALLAYLVFTLWSERRAATPAGEVYAAEADLVAVPDKPAGLGAALGISAVGLAVTVFSARLLVSGAIGLAEAIGLSETVIGLTIVAIGTSMPELVTAVIAVRRGAGDVALGNVIGSNIFNILGILGITAMVAPLEVPAQIASFDIWAMLAATAALLVFAVTGWRVSRREGVGLLLAYAAYLAVLLGGMSLLAVG